MLPSLVQTSQLEILKNLLWHFHLKHISSTAEDSRQKVSEQIFKREPLIAR